VTLENDKIFNYMVLTFYCPNHHKIMEQIA